MKILAIAKQKGGVGLRKGESEAVEAILNGVERMFSKQENHFGKLEAGQKDLQR